MPPHMSSMVSHTPTCEKGEGEGVEEVVGNWRGVVLVLGLEEAASQVLTIVSVTPNTMKRPYMAR